MPGDYDQISFLLIDGTAYLFGLMLGYLEDSAYIKIWQVEGTSN